VVDFNLKEDFTVSRVGQIAGQKNFFDCPLNQLGLPLVVIGSGPELSHQQIAKAQCAVLGCKSDVRLSNTICPRQSFVYAAYEDFAVASSVEASSVELPSLGRLWAGNVVDGSARSAHCARSPGERILFPRQTEDAIAEVGECFEQHQKNLSPDSVPASDHAPLFQSQWSLQQRYMTLRTPHQEFQIRNFNYFLRRQLIC
jgi:hypothetical protein